MKHIRNLWNLLKQEISLWKYEKQELVKGICYIVMIAWLFFDRIAFAILLIPYLFVFMKQQRIHKVHREKEKLRKEFREMMISIGNSLSAGYSIENALKTAKNDLEMYEEHSLLAKELQLLINKLKMNEPVDNLLFDMAEHVGLEEFYQFAQVISIAKKSGGNLIEITENTIEHLSQAIQTKEEIHTMIAAKQMEKKIMSVMPYFILLSVWFVRFSDGVVPGAAHSEKTKIVINQGKSGYAPVPSEEGSVCTSASGWACVSVSDPSSITKPGPYSCVSGSETLMLSVSPAGNENPGPYSAAVSCTSIASVTSPAGVPVSASA